MVGSVFRAAVFAALVSFAVSSAAQEKTGLKPGFSLQPGSARITLMRPAVRVGSQSTGGMFEPNADWTAQSRENIHAALKNCQAKLGNEIVLVGEELPAESALISQYANLFGAVADSVIEYQFFKGNRLPTKVRKGSFDWTLGPGLNSVQSLHGSDYALFVNTRDAYGSFGRKALQLLGALGGIPVQSGEHVGYAGLIDLRTGELVWLNADRQMGGDVRTSEGATKRVRQLLEGFPGRPSEVTTDGVC